MEFQLPNWFVKRNGLGSELIDGEIQKWTEKAILVDGVAKLRPSTHCWKCGKTLTDPVSIELGIGPICAGVDQRDSMTQEEKDEYVRKFSEAHKVSIWIPKKILVNKQEIANLDQKPNSVHNNVQPEWDVSAIIHKGVICVKSRYELAPLCKQIPGGKWERIKKFWYYPLNEHVAKAVIETFKDIEKKKIAQEILDLAGSVDKKQEVKFSTSLPDIPDTKITPWMHQKQGFWFGMQNPNTMLAMDMGTGKTKVAIDLIVNSGDKKVLIICPKVVMDVWPKEFKKHTDADYKVVPLKVLNKELSLAEKQEVAKLAYETLDKVVIVINYESAWRNPIYTHYTDSKGKRKKRLVGYSDLAEWIRSVHWDRIVLDESHKIKQFDGKAATFCSDLEADKKNCLTGTPMPNNPLDIFSQYRFLNKSIFGDNYFRFRSKFAVMGGYLGRQIVGYQNQDELRERMYMAAFRVKTEDVLDLPETMHIPKYFQLSAEAWEYYNQATERDIIEIDDAIVKNQIPIVQMLRWQQITCGYLPIHEERVVDGKPKRVLVDVKKIDSGKAELLEEIIDDIKDDESIVVCCKFQNDLDEIEAVAKKLKRTYGEYSGRRKDALKTDATLKEEIQIAGIQIQAGGVGIDLTRARYTILYSVGHSLGDYEQFIRRSNRPGQERKTFYIHLIAENTVDEIIYSSLSQKMSTVGPIIDYIKQRKNDLKEMLVK